MHYIRPPTRGVVFKHGLDLKSKHPKPTKSTICEIYLKFSKYIKIMTSDGHDMAHATRMNNCIGNLF